MDFKKMWKRFFTLDRHHAEGFTLVELIVVIAILAILAGVAVPAYSGYVDKANKGADQTLVREVRNALELGAYSGIIKNSGYVVLNVNAEATYGGNQGEVAAAMAAVFGANSADTLKLKYDGWNGNYSDSSYQGHETTMMGKVEGLTDLLGDTIADMPSLVGNKFKDFMSTDLGFSAEDMENSDKAADAAVLYVANGTNNLTAEQQEAFKTVATNAGKADDVFGSMLVGFSNIYGSDVMGAAATYAMLTAYCQYEDQKAGNTNMMDALGTPDASGVSTGSLQEMSEMISDSVSRLDSLLEAGNGLNFETYWSEVASKDAAAFIDVMGTVSNAKGEIVDNLGTSGCFTSQEMQNLFTQYSSGAITVLIEVQSNGTIKTTTVPQVN